MKLLIAHSEEVGQKCSPVVDSKMQEICAEHQQQEVKDESDDATTVEEEKLGFKSLLFSSEEQECDDCQTSQLLII